MSTGETASTAAWLAHHGLDKAHARVFDEFGYPKDLPSSLVDALRGTPGLTPRVVQSLHAATIAEHVPLSSLLTHSRRGQPREAFTQAQLDAGFEVFCRDNEPTAATSSLVPMAMAVPGIPVPVPAALPPSAGGGKAAVGVLPIPAAPLPGAAMMPPAAELAAWEMPAHEMAALNETVFLPALKHLRALRWSDWPLDNGNPFVVKITPANAATLSVPDYFEVLSKRSLPMDLTRMLERATVTAAEVQAARTKSTKMAGPRRFPYYPNVDALAEDASYMVHNAKRYNVPRRLYHLRDSDGPFPHPSTLPVAEVGRGSVYAMAFDMEAQILALLPHLRAQEATFRQHAWLRQRAPAPAAGAGGAWGGGGGGGVVPGVVAATAVVVPVPVGGWPGGGGAASGVSGGGVGPGALAAAAGPTSVRFFSSGGASRGGGGGGRPHR